MHHNSNTNIALCPNCSKPMEFKGTKYEYDKNTQRGVSIRIFQCQHCMTWAEIWP